MCGINGIFAYRSTADKVNPAELVGTRDVMAHRGPDGFGEWVARDYSIGLGHRRLAIIDLSDAAHQPMPGYNERYHVVFNGEIYNYKLLRAELKSQNVVFASNSDTEVLLHLYHLYGEGMTSKLRGMFAFAIYDSDNHTLFAARDPYGIKPFYYSDSGNTLRFASEVKALQAVDAISNTTNPAALVGFFLWGSIPEPFTVFEDIQVLPAGHTLSLTKEGTVQIKRYWSLEGTIALSMQAAAETSDANLQDHAVQLVRDSVSAHMVADVPVGAFLSAGLDSSTIVSLAQAQTQHPVQTVTLGFDEFAGNPADEVPGAVAIAEHLGVKHQIIRVDTAGVEKDLEFFLESMDQPTVDGLNTWFVAKAAAETGLKVALSGLGGDELLGGYQTFSSVPQLAQKHLRSAQYRGKSQKPGLLERLYLNYSPEKVAEETKFMSLGGTLLSAYQLKRGMFMPWELKHILRKCVIEEGLERIQENYRTRNQAILPSDFSQLAYLESANYMRHQLLRDSDWIGMAHSLEIRVPLVDSILTERISGLAGLGALGADKSILRYYLSRTLTDNLLSRPKTGFTIPLWRWINTSNKFDLWKQNKFLNNGRSPGVKRWAYTLMGLSGFGDALK